MSAPAVDVLTGTSIGAAARKMDKENVKRLPVIDDVGRRPGHPSGAATTRRGRRDLGSGIRVRRPQPADARTSQSSSLAPG
jgi:CBS domain-containing protein